MASNSTLEPFLQSVIGRDQVLTPSSGRLRTIHARIAKELDDVKQELHLTVQEQWPALKRQYNTTIDLSDRLKAVKSEVHTLEADLDGDESALRPRLHTRFITHSQLAKQYQEADALAELLQSLKRLQQCNATVEKLLVEGRFDEIVPAIQACEGLVNGDIEDWKKESQPYKRMKEQYEHARNKAKERLEEALNQCVTFTDGQLTLSMYTTGLDTPGSHRIRLHSIIKSLAALSTLEKLFQRIAEDLLRTLIRPVLVERRVTISRQLSDNTIQLSAVPSSSAITLEACIESLRTILQAITSSIASDEATSAHRLLLLSYIIPQIQELLIKNVIGSSIPSTADRAVLVAYKETCRVVSEFETHDLIETGIAVDPKVRKWVQHAGEHWANAFVQRSFAALRAYISTSEYWNKTEKVEWIDDPKDTVDKERWERWLSESSLPVVSVGEEQQQQQQPQASTSRLPAPIVPLTARPSADHEPENVEEDVAWEFEEAEEYDSQGVPGLSVSTEGSALEGKRIEESPDPNADVAWGFGDNDSTVELDSDQNPRAVATQSTGHRKNTLSQSSTRSRGSSKGVLTVKGKASYITSSGEIVADDEEEDGGWSFDADEDLDLEEEGNPSILGRDGESSATAVAPVAQVSGHSRTLSSEDAWGWSRNPDPDEQKPIGKPTKIIVSKKLGAKGRAGSAADMPHEQMDVDSGMSRSATPVQSQSTMQNTGGAESSRNADTQKNGSAMPINDAATYNATPEITSLLISSSAKTVAETSLEFLQAALAVSSSVDFSVDIASASMSLFKAASDTFDFYRAIAPVAHSILISTVPSIGVQLSNDCLYVAREGTRIMTTTVESRAHSQEDRASKKRSIDALRQFGYSLLEEQIELQRIPLMETLDEADGFRNSDDPRTFARCQRCVRQLVHTIRSISQAWQPVLLRRVYFETLGILVNAVLLRVLVEIENQEDISEEASHRLNDLCKMLHELEPLFEDGGESTVALHVPVWFKFKFLSELLEASMADIMYLFTEGHLVDFSATELSKLVRALFADSQLRQRNLETIAQGRLK